MLTIETIADEAEQHRGSVPGRPNGMENHASHRSDKSRTNPGGIRQPRDGNVIFREVVEAAHAALEYIDVPFALRPHASRGLDHQPTAVRAGGGFGHGAE